MILKCWNCKNDFEYNPPKQLEQYNKEFFQGSTVCKNCVPLMKTTGGVAVYDYLGGDE